MSDLLWIKKELKRPKYDLEVHGVKGWRDRGHPATYEPRGVMLHHTASRPPANAPALGTVTEGRPDLDGPLCQILIARDATVFLVAAGYAFHAGFGGPFKEIPEDSGNRYFVGIECENDGVGEDWPKKQRRVMSLVSAIILDHFDMPGGYAIDHKQWAPGRKIDLAGINMDTMRGRIRADLRELR